MGQHDISALLHDKFRSIMTRALAVRSGKEPDSPTAVAASIADS